MRCRQFAQRALATCLGLTLAVACQPAPQPPAPYEPAFIAVTGTVGSGTLLRQFVTRSATTATDLDFMPETIQASPDGRRVAHLIGRELSVVPVTGSGTLGTSTWSVDGVKGDLVWSPDGSRIAVSLFTGEDIPVPAVAVLDSATGRQVARIDGSLIRTGSQSPCPGFIPSTLTPRDWSSADDEIVATITKYDGMCAAEPNVYSEMVLIDVSERSVRRIPGTGQRSHWPTLSSDGSLLLYEREGQITITSLKNGRTQTVASGTTPGWSDSDHFAFESSTDGTPSTVVARLLPGDGPMRPWQQVITIPTTSKRPPTWSPDDNWLLMAEPTGAVSVHHIGGAPTWNALTAEQTGLAEYPGDWEYYQHTFVAV